MSKENVEVQQGAEGGITEATDQSKSSQNGCLPKTPKPVKRKEKSKTLTLHKRSSHRNKNGELAEPSWKLTLKPLKLKLPSRLKRAKNHGIPDARPGRDTGNCVCTSYRRNEDHSLGPGIVFNARNIPATQQLRGLEELYPMEDPDLILIQRRLAEMNRGIEMPAASASGNSIDSSLDTNFTRHCAISQTSSPSRTPGYPNLRGNGGIVVSDEHSSELVCSEYGARPGSDSGPSVVHTQIDYIHCLVPNLQKVTNCGYYWGVMDRYEAESLLDNKPEGTFLLRDSAQDEFLFSVSFRRYGRSLHARIEQWNHKFSFDSHDPTVFAEDSVHGLIEHYKDPGSCLFFEPMLVHPLNRTHVFSLQNLCRAAICSNTTYDGISYLTLPKSVKESMRYYHYKQKVRVRKFEISNV